MIELNPKTKEVFSQYPDFKEIWQDVSRENPQPLSSTPYEVCYYMNGNAYVPAWRFVEGVLVNYNEPEDGPYALLTVCDDTPVALSVEGQVLFNNADVVDLPAFDLSPKETLLAQLEERLAELINV